MEHYLKLYHALSESHLAYGISVWGGVPDTKINAIFTVQKHCVRIFLVIMVHILINFVPVLDQGLMKNVT